MSMSKCKAISENEQSIIVKNILGAKDKHKQVQIEADLHESSIGIIKDILKEHGVNLRILNGGNRKKKHIEDELIEETPKEQDVVDAAVEAVKDFDAALSKGQQIEKTKKVYKKPEIIPAPPKRITVSDAVAVIRAELDDISRQQYQLDMRKADLYQQLWDMIGGMA